MATSAEVPGAGRGLIAGSVMLATILEVLDQTIANVALPHMRASLGASQDQASWILTSYIVSAAIAMPLAGILAARFGRKRLFIASVAGFVLASALCGLSTGLAIMIIARLMQGVFGACLVPLSQSILLDTYPKEMHGRAMATFGMGVMAAPIAGPVLGGWITDNFDWRWLFFINVPLGLIALFGILLSVPETKRRPDARFDGLGFALLALAVGGLQLLLDRGEQKEWFSSGEICVYAAVSAVAFWMCFVHSATADHSFLDRRLFRDQNFVSGLGVMFVVGLVLLSTQTLLIPFMQDLQGYPVLDAGLLSAPRGIGALVSMMLVGNLVRKVDARLMIGGGMAATAFSLYLYAGINLDSSAAFLAWVGVLQGFGLGFIFVPLSTVSFGSLASDLRNDATSLTSLTRNIGGAIGVSVAQSMLTRNTQINHSTLAEKTTAFRLAMHKPFLPQIWSPETVTGKMSLSAEITRQASMIAYIDDFLLMAACSALAIPLVLVLRKPKSSAVELGAVH